MKILVRVAAPLLAVLVLSTSAVAKCVPAEPKDITSHIELIPVLRQSITANHFEQNGCDWAGADQLNGFDAAVLDVEGIKGLASITAIVGNLSATPMEVIFLDPECARTGDPATFGQSIESAPEAYTITIPTGAKWALVQGSTDPPAGSASADIDVTLHSDGKVCKKKKH